MAAEKNFENRVKRYLKEQHCWYVKYWGGAEFTRSGVPDLLVCDMTYFFGIELKAENGKPSDLQLYDLEQIDKAGGRAVLLYPKDFDDFKMMIRHPWDDELYKKFKDVWKGALDHAKEKEDNR